MKESRDHRRGGWDLRKIAPLLAEAVGEAEVQAVGSRPSGQRPLVGKMRMVAAPGSGCEAGV